jgi:hypothetical protein
VPSFSVLEWCRENGIKVGDTIWFKWNSARTYKGWQTAVVQHFGDKTVMVQRIGRSPREYLLQDEAIRRPIHEGKDLKEQFQGEAAHAPGTEVRAGEEAVSQEGGEETSIPF